MKIVYERMDSMTCVQTSQRARSLDIPVLVNISSLKEGDELRRFVPKQAKAKARKEEPWVDKAIRDHTTGAKVHCKRT